MKIKSCFSTQQIGDQVFLICTDSSILQGMIKLNTTGAYIVSLLANDISKEDILAELKKKYSGNEEYMKEDIDKIINTLDKLKALEK